MALEVNFYAGTRALYDAEPSLDPGGLYALIDGLGLYRGAQPIAGPCPFDINLLIEQTSEEDRIYQLSGGFQSSESVQSIKEFFASHPGNGGRPVRVKFTYTSGTPLSRAALDNVNLMMYSNIEYGVPNDTGVVGKFTAIEFNPQRRIENELIDCVIYKLYLLEPDVFYMDIREFSLSATDIPTSEIVASINENRDAITELSTRLTNEITRATKAESELNTKIADEATRAKKAESDITASVTSEANRAKQAESDLSSKIDDEATRAKNAESAIQTKVDTNTTNIATNAEDIVAANQNINQLLQTVRQLDEKITAASGDVSGLVDKINKNATDIANLTTKVNKNTSDISSMNTTVSQNTTDIETNTSNINTIQTRMSDLDKRIDNIETCGVGGPFWVDYLV